MGGCYKHFSKATLSWSDARKHCGRMKAELPSIHSPEENEFLLTLSSQHEYNGNDNDNDDYTWLGGSDRETEKLFVWTDQTPWSYVNWVDGEPNDDDGKQDCILMHTPKSSKDIYKGKWTDYRCNYNSTFICKLPRTG